MTRFYIPLPRAARFVVDFLEHMDGGEIFAPKMTALKITSLAPIDAEFFNIGMRAGEKLHEALISEDEARTVVDLDDMYVVQPAEAFWFGHEWSDKGKKLPDDFKYVSNLNDEWLTVVQIQDILQPIEMESK